MSACLGILGGIRGLYGARNTLGPGPCLPLLDTILRHLPLGCGRADLPLFPSFPGFLREGRAIGSEFNERSFIDPEETQVPGPVVPPDLPRDRIAAGQLPYLADQIAESGFKIRKGGAEPLYPPDRDRIKNSRASNHQIEQGILSRLDHVDNTPTFRYRLRELPALVRVPTPAHSLPPPRARSDWNSRFIGRVRMLTV